MVADLSLCRSQDLWRRQDRQVQYLVKAPKYRVVTLYRPLFKTFDQIKSFPHPTTRWDHRRLRPTKCPGSRPKREAPPHLCRHLCRMHLPSRMLCRALQVALLKHLKKKCKNHLKSLTLSYKLRWRTFYVALSELHTHQSIGRNNAQVVWRCYVGVRGNRARSFIIDALPLVWRGHTRIFFWM